MDLYLQLIVEKSFSILTYKKKKKKKKKKRC